MTPNVRRCRGFTIAAAALATLLAPACTARQPPARESRAVRPSASSEQEHGVFERDRLALSQHERARRHHAEAHRRQRALIVRAGLPQCVGVQMPHRCPLLRHAWQVRRVPRGIEISTPMSAARAAALETELRCHHALGRRYDRREDICVLQSRDIEMHTNFYAASVSVRLTATREARIRKLRQRVRALVANTRRR